MWKWCKEDCGSSLSNIGNTESDSPLFPVNHYEGRVRSLMDLMHQPQWIAAACDRVLKRSHRSRHSGKPDVGKLARPGVGSAAGGERAAILLSLIASAKLCHVEPWAWLNAVLQELPGRQATASEHDQPPDLTDLLPDAWLANHPQHRWQIDDLRKKERQKSRQQKANKRSPLPPPCGSPCAYDQVLECGEIVSCLGEFFV